VPHFLLHVLPSGLVRIRQFGFLANRFRTQKLQLCRTLLAVCQPSTPAGSHNPADTNLPDRSSCPICKLGRLIMIEVIHPERTMVPDTSCPSRATFLVEFLHPTLGGHLKTGHMWTLQSKVSTDGRFWVSPEDPQFTRWPIHAIAVHID